MNKLKLTLIAGIIAGISGAALADGDNKGKKRHSNVVDAPMSRISADAASGDKVSTVRNNCGGGVEGWDDATASIEISQKGSGSKVEIEIDDGKPDTLYTVWVRMKGTAHGTTFGGSPMTGGGATPLAHSSHLDQLVADWVGAGSPTAGNSFRTNDEGEGEFEVDLDFPVVGGAYPFNRMSHDAHLLAQTKNPAANPNPTAIVNPADVGVGPSGTPFLIRMISHCQDDLAHGLSPAKREAWFQYP
ncbi:MAG: hypothetical protein DRQ44_03430 [Gammaproteobacteria bacterium]|nr:MAG: hypothetical protein DRQ44_03430 [Gammaproteobacteria bacterium]